MGQGGLVGKVGKVGVLKVKSYRKCACWYDAKASCIFGVALPRIPHFPSPIFKPYQP